MALNGTYNFKEVSLVFGIKSLSGFEDGSEIVAERTEDTFTSKVGVDGEVTRSKSNNSMGTITFTLDQFSSDNRYLQSIANLDERVGLGGILPVKLVDKSNPNNEIAIATQAWIKKPASKSYGRESGAREWVIECADLNFIF
jgi:hypothetical protein